MVCVINSSSRQRKEGREILLMDLNCHVVLFAKFKTPIRICAATHSLFHFHALQLIYPSIQAMKFQPSPVQLVRQINRQRGILHCIHFKRIRNVTLTFIRKRRNRSLGEEKLTIHVQAFDVVVVGGRRWRLSVASIGESIGACV